MMEDNNEFTTSIKIILQKAQIEIYQMLILYMCIHLGFKCVGSHKLAGCSAGTEHDENVEDLLPT